MHEKKELDFDEDASEEANEEEMSEKEKFIALLRPFHGHLRTGRQALLKKRRSLLEFIFGRHPKVILAINLNSAAEQLETLFAFLAQKDAALSRDFCRFFEVFKEEVNKSWNPRLYGVRFHELCNLFEQLLERLETEEL